MRNLVVDGVVVSLSGTQEYDNVNIINGGQLRVDTSVQWLELIVAGEVRVDSSSSIVADAMSSGPGDGQSVTFYAIVGGGGAGYGGSGGRGDGKYGWTAASGTAYGYADAGGNDTGSKDGDGKYASFPGGQGGLGGGRIKINA